MHLFVSLAVLTLLFVAQICFIPAVALMIFIIKRKCSKLEFNSSALSNLIERSLVALKKLFAAKYLWRVGLALSAVFMATGFMWFAV